ncbi:apolipoprotein D-like isoform X3 [Hermetia illucens]|nr:apolipoprotein D-like isoform X3 [Hermetia illucens]
MAKVLCLIAMFVVTFEVVHSHTYHAGSCPTVEPMSGFNMKQFLGIWYAIQKTSTASTCLVYNITLGDEPGEYRIKQTSQHFALSLTRIKHQYSYTGEISIPDPEIPAKMQVKFPLNIFGSSSFTIFMSDYVQYAGIFSCQKLGFLHRRSATLLSRTRDLDKIFIDKMRSRLSSFNVDPFDLSIIEQTECPKNESQGLNIHIDDETFSVRRIANVFRQAGRKIGDGVEYVVIAGKKFYHQVSDDGKNVSSTVAVVSSDKAKNMIFPPGESDAEWIRV